MKRTIAVCACILFVAGAFSSQQPLERLPLGSKDAIIAQIERGLDTIIFGAQTKTYRDCFVGNWTYYDPSMGSVESVRSNLVTSVMQHLVTTQDIGQASCMFVATSKPRQIFEYSVAYSAPRDFTVQFDQQGNLIIPCEDILCWPWIWFIPIPDGLRGVTWVSHSLINSNGATVKFDASRNGFISSCGGTAMWTNGTLFLNMDFVDPDMLRASNYTCRVRLYYDSERTSYDEFSAATGNKIDSTVVRLPISTQGVYPHVSITGWPGKKVAMEISSDLAHWTNTGAIVTLGQDGRGSFTNLPPSQVLFVRGRLVP